MFTNSITETQNWDWNHKANSLLLITTKLSLNFQRNIFVYRSDLETTILASFPPKSLNYRVISSYLQMSTLTIAIVTTSTRTVVTLQTNVKKLRAKTMFSAFTPDCRYNISIIKFIGNVDCPQAMCSSNTLRAQKDFPIFWKKQPTMSSMLVHVSGAQYFEEKQN